jgi:asparagine synthase (glutamine-hydrolysing)
MVRESVVSRSIADVSLGTFLSGVDSSIVSLCLAQQSSTKIETIGFDEKSLTKLINLEL